ncbi:unnamed protein product [Trichobilharzia regenti]|nr:unnamed protein product [Trichobilharzia regenti]
MRLSHPLSVEIGLVKFSSDRTQKLNSTKENLRQEVRHIRRALILDNYPDKLARKYVRKCKNKINNNSSDSDNNNNDNNNNDNNNNGNNNNIIINDDNNNKESKSSVLIP